MPKVSVIITTYNRANFICDTIESVLSQTFKDFELIVVDNGSTDGTKQILTKYNPFINYLYRENKSRPGGRNTGIGAAKGKYIAFLDDDDIWLSYKLERQVSFLDSRPDIGLVNTFTQAIDEHGCLLQRETKIHLKLYKKVMNIGYNYEGMSRLCIMFLSTVMLRKGCLNEVGYFDPYIECLEDWDFYLRFSLKYLIATIPEPLVKYRIHRVQTTKDEFIRGCINVSLKHLKLVESNHNLFFSNRIKHNLYMHLAVVYYMGREFSLFKIYIFKALKLNPSAIFYSHSGIYFLMALLPNSFIWIIRNLKSIIR